MKRCGCGWRGPSALFGRGVGAGAEHGRGAAGAQQRVGELGEPGLGAVGAVVGEAVGGRVAARDVGGAEQDVPQEQQVAVVAAIVADAVVLGEGVVGEVGGRGRDGALESARRAGAGPGGERTGPAVPAHR
jgi:hypothetical protein